MILVYDLLFAPCIFELLNPAIQLHTLLDTVHTDSRHTCLR